MADAATEDVRTICPDMHLTGPRAFGGKSGHCDLDFADKVLEESSAIVRWCFERFGDRVPQHGVGWRVEDARLEFGATHRSKDDHPPGHRQTISRDPQFSASTACDGARIH